jgi:hypothetical protein
METKTVSKQVSQFTMGHFLEGYWKLFDAQADLSKIGLDGPAEELREGAQLAITEIGKALNINITWRTRGQGLLSRDIESVTTEQITEAFRKAKESCPKDMFDAIRDRKDIEHVRMIGRAYALDQMERTLILTGIIRK